MDVTGLDLAQLGTALGAVANGKANADGSNASGIWGGIVVRNLASYRRKPIKKERSCKMKKTNGENVC